MKFPFLSAVCMLLSMATILAGCSSPPSSPDTITLPSGTLPAAAGTLPQGNELSQLILTKDEIPFVAAAENSNTPDLTEPSLSRFDAIRGITHFYINEKSPSPTALQLGQIIIQYPPGNATLAFADFLDQNRHADQTQYNITFYHITNFVNESIAMTIVNRTDHTQSTAMIVFRKSDYMESVVLKGPKLDTGALTRSARLAAAKIPS
jgi:hypothetical protein